MPDTDGLSAEDLEAEEAMALPEREAMSKIGIGAGLGIDNFAMPINEATAINIASTDSIAIADADQIMIINQVDQD
jgi:NAD(P)H-hydrate repair Nnr-like enzyme with NAD(P)H-hydrate dehydratase domain